MDTNLVLVLTGTPDPDTAHRMAEALVGERLAACVNVLGACRSIYRWQGEIERAEEVPLLIKTTVAAWPALARRLRELHPYEVPEIVAWEPSQVAGDYLAWVAGQTVAAKGAQDAD